MADISKINLSGAVYNIKDATARANLNEIQNISNAEIDEITDFVLESLPSSYVYGYETAAAVQADLDLQEGMIVHTNGFTTSGDGNAAYYTISNSGTVNGSTILALQNGLKAIKVSENNSIVTANIQDSAITTTKIADNAVTADKIASTAVDGLRTMTITQPGVAKVGAGLAMNDGALELNGGDIAPAVTVWLDAHPEATTTVQDGSISNSKLVQSGGVLSEVNDIRTDFKDVVHDTAGDSVRSQALELMGEIDTISEVNNIATITQDALVYYNPDNITAEVNDGQIILTRIAVANAPAGIMFDGLTIGDTYHVSIDVTGLLLNAPVLYHTVDANGSFSTGIVTTELSDSGTYDATFIAPASTVAIKVTVKYNATTVVIKGISLYSGKSRVVGLSNLSNELAQKVGAIYGLLDLELPAFTPGYINKNTGEITNASIYEYTAGYIPLVMGNIRRTLKYQVLLGYSAALAVYDSSMQLMYTIYGPESSTAVIKGEITDGYYVRLTRSVDSSKVRSFSIGSLMLVPSSSHSGDDSTMVVSLLNGQAVTGGSRECILVQFPNGKNLLMDTGWASTATEVKNQILARGVTKLDYIMITHYHGDHAGGLQKWLEDGLLSTDGTGTFNVDGCVAYLPPEITTTNIEECWRIEGVDGVQALVDRQDYIIDGLTELGVTIVNPTEGQLVVVGDAAMRFWNCDHTPYSSDQGTTYKSSNYNDFSLCCQVEYGSMSFNNTADIGVIAQSYMAGKLMKCVFMTGPHHGWSNNINGLYPDFINNVNPDVVVTPNGSPHYPSPDNTNGANVLNSSSPLQTWCERNNVGNYMTCTNGPIDITFYRHGWVFNGPYSKFIRNGKNWKYSDNSEYIET